MPNGENLRPQHREGIHFESAYSEVTQSPRIVAMQTDKLLRLLASEVLSDQSQAREYLLGFTLPYLDNAARGGQELQDVLFPAPFASSDRGERAAIVQLRKETEARVDHRLREASRHVMTVFGYMLTLSEHPTTGKFLSKRHTIQPPRTLKEYSARLDEMERQVRFVILGYQPHASLTKPSLYRTVAFFRVAAWLPEKEPTSIPKIFLEEGHQDDPLKKGVNRLLEGVDVALLKEPDPHQVFLDTERLLKEALGSDMLSDFERQTGWTEKELQEGKQYNPENYT